MDPIPSELSALAKAVAAEVEGFTIPKANPDRWGSVLPDQWFLDHIADMNGALVEPYEFEVDDPRDGEGDWIRRKVVIVADDGSGTLLAYDPSPEGDFVLIWATQRSGHEISNIRGDPVGCFLSI